MAKKILVFLTVIVLAFGVAAAVFIKNSFYKLDVTQEVLSAQRILGVADEMPFDYIDTLGDTITLEDTIETAGLIVRVKATDEIQYREYTIVRKVAVVQTYKGACAEEIFIAEPVFINFVGTEERSGIYPNEGYNLMQPQGEYLLFLTKLPTAEKRIETDAESRTYLVVNKAFGKYQYGQTAPTPVIEWGSPEEPFPSFTYTDVADYEILTTSLEFYNAYFAWKQEALALYPK